jgi:hypothetical protein
MNLGESLRKLIKDNINSTRPFFGYVIEQNADNTWVVQPIDDQPVINNVQTFQTDIDGNDPIIGSLVLCIFIDDYNSFITEIIEYNTWYINSETSSILGSNDITIVSGKRVVINSSEKTTEDLKQIIEQNNAGFAAGENCLALVSEGWVEMASNETFDDNQNVAYIRLNNKDTFGDLRGMIIENYTSLGTDILSKNLMVIEGQNGIDIRSNPVKIESNQIQLSDILQSISDITSNLQTLISLYTPIPANASAISTAAALITTQNTALSTSVSTFKQ